LSGSTVSRSILIVSPVRNEADHIERVARAVAAQTVPPDLWIVVDDHSTDGTREILSALRGEIGFLRVIGAPAANELPAHRDRLGAAAAPRAFNAGLRTVDASAYDFVCKLDGDVELPPDYFEQLLRRFDADAGLGIACGDLVEQFGDEWRRIAIPEHHVHGALKLYSRRCFADIGGVRDTLGWDSIDEATARRLGYTTRSFRDVIVRHNRHWGSADGKLRGRARHGVAAWIIGYGPGWAFVRSLKLASVRPRGVSGGAFLFGYLRAALRGTARVEPELRRHVRSELRGRARRVARRVILRQLRPVSR
jgi:poly-beta-1,6-N-acetyl-D-glucosamine synthase